MNLDPRSPTFVILDRDGTIVIDRGYLSDPDGLEFLPGAADGLQRLHTAGFRLIVITNQSGVGRGFFTVDSVLRMNARLREMIDSVGAKLEAIYFCPHSPDDLCLCRKPALGLMNRAAADFAFDPRGTFVIGDRQSDIEFGRRAGAATVLINENHNHTFLTPAPDFVATDLVQAADAIILDNPRTTR